MKELRRSSEAYSKHCQTPKMKLFGSAPIWFPLGGNRLFEKNAGLGNE